MALSRRELGARDREKEESVALYEFEGIRPVVPEDDDYWVAPDAQVMGRVEMKKGSSVWFGVSPPR